MRADLGPEQDSNYIDRIGSSEIDRFKGLSFLPTENYRNNVKRFFEEPFIVFFDAFIFP